MTERKPREISFASWVDQQIAEAAERGAFDDLPGAGKPIPRRGGVDAWLQDYLRREGVSADEMLPTPLRLRKEIERLAETIQDLHSEDEVREVVRGLNRRILEWRRIPTGPPIYLRLVDAEAMVARWRDARRRPSAPAPAARPDTDPPRRRSRRWRRRALRPVSASASHRLSMPSSRSRPARMPRPGATSAMRPYSRAGAPAVHEKSGGAPSTSTHVPGRAAGRQWRYGYQPESR